MRASTHLVFRGDCEAAFRFYAACLRAGEPYVLRYGDSPAGDTVPPPWRDKAIHASLAIGDTTLAGADLLDARPHEGFFVLLDIEDPADAERVYNELSAGGTIVMPLQETFWARRFAVFTDRYGVPWEINCGRGA